MYPFKLHSNGILAICPKNKPFFAETLKAGRQWLSHQRVKFCRLISFKRSDPANLYSNQLVSTNLTPQVDESFCFANNQTSNTMMAVLLIDHKSKT
jgi:hypothetical protein